MKTRSPVYKMDSTEELIGMVEFVYRILFDNEKERERKTTMTRIRRDELPSRLVSYEMLLLAPA